MPESHRLGSYAPTERQQRAAETFGGTVSAMRTAEVSGLRSHTPLRWVVGACLLAVGFAGGLLLASIAVLAGRLIGELPWSGNDEVAVVASPNDRYEVVVYRETSVIDPVWRVAVRQRGELWPDQWTVGCINGDDGTVFKSVRWEDRTTLVVGATSGTAVVDVDRTTGEPAEPDSDLWNWDC